MSPLHFRLSPACRRCLGWAAVFGLLGTSGGLTARPASDAGQGSDFLERTVELNHRYLNVPVKADAPRRTISVIIDGKVVRAFEAEVAEGRPDFWAFTDLGEWHGRRATLRLGLVGKWGDAETQARSRAHPLQADTLERLRITDDVVDAEELYHEPLRPRFHFTTRRGWLNDPHGPIYYQGEYHLFYQHFPFSMNRVLNGDKAWGHAVSPDLVHWTERAIALYPDESGGIMSGSAVIDWRNAAGFQQGPDPALLLFYTLGVGRSVVNAHPEWPADYVQCVAYSNDHGRTFTKYAANPVLKTITPANRDPQVLWHGASNRWVMVLYVGYPVSNPGNQYTAQIFTSDNLRDWTYQSRIEGFFDCPTLFELPLDGNAGEPRWIIHCANMKYKVGRFDGRTFTPETELIEAHVGKVEESAYAASIAVGVPDGRHIQLAWLYKKSPAPGVRQQMTFPCELRLVTTSAGPRLEREPIREIEKLRGSRTLEHDLHLSPGAAPRAWRAGPQLQVKLRFPLLPAAEVTLTVHGIPLVVNTAERQLRVQGYRVALPAEAKDLDLQVLLDRTSIEIFAGSGRVYLPLAVTVPPESNSVTLATTGADVAVSSFELYELNSIWSAAAPAVSPP